MDEQLKYAKLIDFGDEPENILPEEPLDLDNLQAFNLDDILDVPAENLVAEDLAEQPFELETLADDNASEVDEFSIDFDDNNNAFAVTSVEPVFEEGAVCIEPETVALEDGFPQAVAEDAGEDILEPEFAEEPLASEETQSSWMAEEEPLFEKPEPEIEEIPLVADAEPVFEPDHEPVFEPDHEPVFEAEAVAENPVELYETVPNFVRWYSGSVHEQMFELSKQELPQELFGSSACNIVHLNIGYDSYGWLVEFDNGLIMSLEDVRRYQIKNGALPSAGGIIRYGQGSCRFSDIERILIYETVRYFSYGA